MVGHTHVVPYEVGAGGRDGEHGHVVELPLEDAQLAILRAEVVPPLVQRSRSGKRKRAR